MDGRGSLLYDSVSDRFGPEIGEACAGMMEVVKSGYLLQIGPHSNESIVRSMK